MEEKRPKHELKLLKRQQEFETSEKGRLPTLTKWEDRDQPEA